MAKPIMKLAMRWQYLVPLIIPAITILLYAPIFGDQWRDARGYEYEWVAMPLAEGHGYSFDRGTAWLGPYAGGSDYSPTAWIEPAHTAVMAIVFKLFGETGRLVLVLLNAFWLSMTSVNIYLLARRFVGPTPSFTVAALFILLPYHRTELLIYIGNSAIAVFLHSLTALLLIRCLEQVSYKRCLTLGAVIGIAVLTHAGMLLWLPLTALIILTRAGIQNREVWKMVGAQGIIAVAILLPWMLRNIVTFDEFIPVRTGFGFNAYIGNPGLASTFMPELRNDDIAAETQLWIASDPWQALAILRALHNQAVLFSYSIGTVWSLAPEDFASYNEAQRDDFFRSQAVAFVLSMPLVAARMAFWKTIAFFASWGLVFRLSALGALLGWLLRLRDFRATSLMLLLAAYIFPYTISLPLYYRYRFPVEPLLFVLASIVVGITFTMIKKFADYSWGLLMAGRKLA